MNNDNNTYLFITWSNAIMGSFFDKILSQPVLSTASYLVSICGGIVYIYTNLKKKK